MILISKKKHLQIPFALIHRSVKGGEVEREHFGPRSKSKLMSKTKDGGRNLFDIYVPTCTKHWDKKILSNNQENSKGKKRWGFRNASLTDGFLLDLPPPTSPPSQTHHLISQS
jgi:hypothetical protein